MIDNSISLGLNRHRRSIGDIPGDQSHQTHFSVKSLNWFRRGKKGLKHRIFNFYLLNVQTKYLHSYPTGSARHVHETTAVQAQEVSPGSHWRRLSSFLLQPRCTRRLLQTPKCSAMIIILGRPVLDHRTFTRKVTISFDVLQRTPWTTFSGDHLHHAGRASFTTASSVGNSLLIPVTIKVTFPSVSMRELELTGCRFGN